MLGINYLPRITCVPLDHFIMPLLNCLIGIGDNMLVKLCNSINGKINFLNPAEVNHFLSQVTMGNGTNNTVANCEAFNTPVEEKSRMSLEEKITQCRVIM